MVLMLSLIFVQSFIELQENNKTNSSFFTATFANKDRMMHSTFVDYKLTFDSSLINNHLHKK